MSPADPPMTPGVAPRRIAYAGRARRLRRGRGPRRLRRRGADLGGCFREVFEAVATGDRGRRRRPDRERHQRHGPRELRPAARARPGDPGRGRRAGPASAWPRCRASASRTSSGSTRTSRRSARPRRSCAPRPWQLLTTYNTAGAGKAIARPRRARRRGGPLAAGRRPVRARDPRRRHRRPGRQPDPVRRPGPAGAPDRCALRADRRRAAGRRSSSPSATSRARCSRSCGCSPTTA